MPFNLRFAFLPITQANLSNRFEQQSEVMGGGTHELHTAQKTNASCFNSLYISVSTAFLFAPVQILSRRGLPQFLKSKVTKPELLYPANHMKQKKQRVTS